MKRAGRKIGLLPCVLASIALGPAANVTGDGAIALLVERFFGKEKTK